MSGTNSDPIGSILSTTFGDVGSKVALALLLFAFVSCTIAIQGAAIRLVYSFARDGMVAGSGACCRASTLASTCPQARSSSRPSSRRSSPCCPSATVAIIITFAVVGIYIGFQSVVLAALIARSRGWRPSGSFQLGRWSRAVNIVALIYGVSAIVILSYETGEGQAEFVDRWLVPLSAAVVFVQGLAYLLVFRPAEHIREDARPE